ncbi:hypothetical protein ACOME3_003327 [Neoechinorhynchus agilis]
MHYLPKVKIQRHVKVPLEKFKLPSGRFDHIHVDLLIDLPAGTFCLTVAFLVVTEGRNLSVEQQCAASTNSVLEQHYWSNTSRLPDTTRLRFQTPPEMILGLPIAKSIDMRSLGCTIGELAVGRPMFPGSGDYETLARIKIARGVIPNAVLDNGVRTLLYSKRTINGDGWVLKSPLERGIFPPSSIALHPPLVSLNIIISLKPRDYRTQQDTQNNNKFLAMLDRMLKLPPRVELIELSPLFRER